MLKALTIATSIALVAITPAAASDRDDAVTAEVRIDDLNLANRAGQQLLDRRIDNAARRICATGARGLAAVTAENRCIALARASAAPQAERAIALATSGRRLARIDMQITG